MKDARSLAIGRYTRDLQQSRFLYILGAGSLSVRHHSKQLLMTELSLCSGVVEAQQVGFWTLGESTLDLRHSWCVSALGTGPVSERAFNVGACF